MPEESYPTCLPHVAGHHVAALSQMTLIQSESDRCAAFAAAIHALFWSGVQTSGTRSVLLIVCIW